jgi:hypothetical protein
MGTTKLIYVVFDRVIVSIVPYNLEQRYYNRDR